MPLIIEPDLFELYEECILSGQISAEAVSAILRENPAFEAWMRARATQRQTQSAA